MATGAEARGLRCLGRRPLSQGVALAPAVPSSPTDAPVGPLTWPRQGCLPWGRMHRSQAARGAHTGCPHARTHTATAWAQNLRHHVGRQRLGSAWHPSAPHHGEAHTSFVAETLRVQRKNQNRGVRVVSPNTSALPACEQSPIPDKHRKCKDRTGSWGAGRGGLLSCRKEGGKMTASAQALSLPSPSRMLSLP